MSFNYHSPLTSPLLQNWSNKGLITSDDNWDGVLSLIGYRGDISAATTNSVNNAPIVATSSELITYTETENVSAIAIDSTATVTDDSPNFNTGTLTVSLTAGATADDRLAIRNQGDGAGQISIDGRIVKYGSTQIGTFIGGSGTDPLVITFNANATPAAAQALLQNISYSNVSQNPSITSRTVSFVLTDGEGGISNTASKTLNVQAVNDAPFIGASVTQYDSLSGTTPDSQGFDYIAIGGSQSFSNGATTLDTSGNSNSYAGYFAKNVPTLDPTKGFTVSFTAQVVSENHTGSDKNGDGIGDRAGFSVIVLGNDKKGIELGFWQNQIWAQEDGTTQANPSANPTTTPPGNTNVLFTHAEGANFNTTTGLIPYDLTILGDTYTLSTGNSVILSGKVRDYTAFSGLVDPYETPNLVFLGDDTTSANAKVNLSAVSISTNSTLSPQTVNEDTSLAIQGLKITDVDAGSNNITVNLSVSNGQLSVNNTVTGGLAAANITGNNSSSVTVTGTLSQINTTLANVSGLSYQGNLNFNGSDTLTLTTNDGGSSGTGGIQSNTKTVTINVNPLNDAPMINNPIADQTTETNTPFDFQLPANTFNDVDAGDSLTYTATRSDGTALPNWLSFDSTTLTLTGTPTTSDAGDLSIKLQATDTSGASVSDTFNLAVASSNLYTVGGFTWNSNNLVTGGSLIYGTTGTDVITFGSGLFQDSGQPLASNTVGNLLSGLPNDTVNLGNNTAPAAMVLDWGGQPLTNLAGNDFVIYENGFQGEPEAFAVGVVTAGTLTGFRYEYYDSFDDASVSNPADGVGVFATAFDLSDFGIAEGQSIDKILIANLLPSDRISGIDGQGFVGSQYTNTPLNPITGQPFAADKFDPDITLVAALHDVGF